MKTIQNRLELVRGQKQIRSLA